MKRKDDIRPISLCDCVYNIISKFVASRLKIILLKGTSSKQFSFLENRKIHDAIGIAQEVIQSVKIMKYPSIVMKDNISKAYDKVN